MARERLVIVSGASTATPSAWFALPGWLLASEARYDVAVGGHQGQQHCHCRRRSQKTQMHAFRMATQLAVSFATGTSYEVLLKQTNRHRLHPLHSFFAEVLDAQGCSVKIKTMLSTLRACHASINLGVILRWRCSCSSCCCCLPARPDTLGLSLSLPFAF
jgi:hypothetical protein